jgi:hypothetical protein
MPRIPIIRLRPTAETLEPPHLTRYTPAISLEGLQLGVDNLRHDVHLSFKFVDQARLQIARLITRHGGIEGLIMAEALEKPRSRNLPGAGWSKPAEKVQTLELKPLLLDAHIAALNRAKAAENISIDLLARLAIIKFLRIELNAQFAQLLERGRMTLKGYEGVRQQKALEYREKVAAFQVAKKIILRKAGQELFGILREIEKETLARTRRSLFSDGAEAMYKLFLNPLILIEDGSDTYLNAQHYVMLGNFDKDPDRFSNIRRVVCEIIRSINVGFEGSSNEEVVDGWLNVPENAQVMVGAGNDDSTRSQKVRLQMWTDLLEREELMEYVVASYEVVPMLSEYSPRINPQQLKHALISRQERERVEKLIEEHGKLTCESFYSAMARVASYGGAERSKIAARFLRDFIRYHRDLRRLEALNGALDSVNLVGNQKIRDLSAMNGTLYEFMLPQEQKTDEDKILRHVIVKADVRDSSRLTRSLLEREMNPASYFSLNFYDPVNKLLTKYGAKKVFLEGDAIILALLDREGEAGLAVSRACVLAREIIEIVRGYNQLLQRAGLPGLELGIGISFQDSAPMYLMDGEDRIMISEAINESDRLASCNKRIRKSMERLNSPFNVYAFQTLNDAGAADNADDFTMKYNLNGIRMSETAFQRLQQEIVLEPCRLQFPQLWGSEGFRLLVGTVPIGNDIFRKVVVRVSRIPQIEPSSFSLQTWTARPYYEVCANAAVYTAVDGKAVAGK